MRRNFIEITLEDGCSPLNMLHIFRTPENTSERLPLKHDGITSHAFNRIGIESIFLFM